MEEDIWVEYLALRRGGWSEVRWREWLRVAQEERRQRQRWWDLVELWATERWGGIVGGYTTAADLVWQATGDATGGGRPLATNRDWPLAELDRALLPKG